MTRSESKRELVSGLGATPVVADALDPRAVAQAVVEAEPEVIVHQLTALAGGIGTRRIERSFELTNRLRSEGTDNLLAAGRAIGIRRFVAQSYAGWPFARVGRPVKTEDDPLDADPPQQLRNTLAAIRHLEDTVAGAEDVEGIVLRYGGFYGPGTWLELDPEGEQVTALRKRKLPVVGDGGGVWSFVHVEDAARALGAKPPRRVPRWVGRLVAGEAAVAMMTEIRGASNAKAKRELGWQPSHKSLWESLAG
jgi:nucleoside-diphosphate-sugar epimerase